MFNPDILKEIISWVPRITPLICVNKWLCDRLRDHPEAVFWREYREDHDIYERGLPKYLELVTSRIASRLECSARAGNFPLVKHLTAAGVDPIESDRAIISAAQYGHTAVVVYLVSVGSDPRAYDDYPMRIAAECGHADIVRYLVSVGADPRANDNTAVICAAMHGHAEVVRYLCGAGADPRANRNRAIKLAIARGHTETVEYLLSIGATL